MTTKKAIKILVIEDDTVTRMAICNTLRKHEYAAVEACNGLMGMTLYAREFPDIVLTDLYMPDQAGLETIYAIHALNPAVKIVAMTACPDDRPDLLEMALDIGAKKSLRKPFTPEQLMKTIEDIYFSTS